MAEQRRRRAAVIGSGFGGLAVAIRLQAAGIATTLYEARDLPGGRAYVYRDQGFTFDAGPTVITAPECLHELFELAGRKLEDYCELMPVHPFYRLLWEDGDSFDYTGDHAAMRAQIAARRAEDAEGYDRFVDYTRKVYEKGYQELVAVPFVSFADMVRVAPDLARLRADRSVYASVASFVKDDRVRQALSFHSLLVGGNPFDTSAIYTLIHYLERKGGVYFARGGTGALVRALVALFQDLGGELRLSTPVRAVRVSERDGSTVHTVEAGDDAPTAFDLVVSNADLAHTYGRLFADVPGASRMLRKVERGDWSMSLFVLYFGTSRNYDDIAHHTILFGPRYRELLTDIFCGSKLPEDFSLYLHAPTVTDPSMAPPGCGCYYVLSPVPHLGNAAVDWDQVATAYGDRILASLERLMPDVRANIVTRRHFTPRDFERELGAHQGSAFSLAPRLMQSAWFRPHNRDPRIPNLYIVGAGTHPGAGVPGVINSAKATASLILAEHMP